MNKSAMVRLKTIEQGAVKKTLTPAQLIESANGLIRRAQRETETLIAPAS